MIIIIIGCGSYKKYKPKAQRQTNFDIDVDDEVDAAFDDVIEQHPLLLFDENGCDNGNDAECL